MLSGLLNIGQSALNASSAWISVTGNNLANVDTEGYSRQYVDQKDAGGLTYNPGAQPLGVNAQQIMRFFDQFLEKAYVRQNTNSSRWDKQDTIMATVENIFNEANRTGISSALTNFFGAWQDLALRPDDTSVRVSLLSYADNLSDMFTGTMDSLTAIQEEMNVYIKQDVERVNELAKAIADINRQITAVTVDGISNPNSLYDQRDQLVREMSNYVDVETIDHGKGDFRVQLTTGQPMVDGVETYSLAVLAAQTDKVPVAGSSYAGDIKYQGTDTYEYTFEVIGSGDALKNGEKGEGISVRVSLDGGATWLKGEDGKDLTYPITYSDVPDLNENGEPKYDGEGKPMTKKVVDEIVVKNLTISFTNAENFTAGDKFLITPKDGLYWITPTGGAQNITPQIGLNGVQNEKRVTGGTLAAYFNVRDDNIGRYKDELNAVASSLIWEVNRIHSQGTGLSTLPYATGTQQVLDANKALGTAQAQLAYYDKLQGGSVNFHFYDSNITGDNDNYVSSGKLVFVGAYGPNFDPEHHTLNDVKDALNGIKIKLGIEGEEPDGTGVFKAYIQDNKLMIDMSDEAAAAGIQFAMGADSTGLMAALGINTFFSGSGAQDIAVNTQIHTNSQLIASGQVNGQFQINAGDNATATAIGKLLDTPVTITTLWKTVENQTLSQYYANLVSTVGADRRLSKTNTEYHGALTNDLYDRVSSVTGVNMDEEMSNLIKFQHSYTAAAKLITTADEMLQTLLGLKQ